MDRRDRAALASISIYVLIPFSRFPFSRSQNNGEQQIDAYDSLGNPTTQTDRSRTSHAYTYDAMGRLLSDVTSGLPQAGSILLMNGAVAGRYYAYDVFSRLTDAATKDSSGNVTTDDMRVYDGLGDLTDEYQNHAGAVNTATSPDVHYDYDTNFTDNYSRLQYEVYPNGRKLKYNYNGNAGLDNSISRLTSLSDVGGTYATQVLATYTYLGLNTMVSETLPQENVELSYRTADAGTNAPKNPNSGTYDAGPSDPYSGLDRFGRVIDQNWFVIGGSTIDRNQYAYDADGNELYDNNLGPTSTLQSQDSELFGGNGVPATTVASNGAVTGDYDALNRLTTFNTGALSISSGATRLNTISGGASTAPTWGMNSQGIYQRSDTNNWATTQPIFQGIFTELQMYQAVQQSPGIPTPSNVGSGANVSSLSVEFDAWGDLTNLQQWNTNFQWQSSGAFGYGGAATATWVQANTTLVSNTAYSYDALGRRISENGTQLYYDAAGNVIEERNSTSSPTATTQYVWSPVGGNTLILRDRALYTGGSLGKAGSGLVQRLYAVQDPSNSVTAILGVTAGGGNGYVVERYSYAPSGSVTVLNANGAVLGIASSNSKVGWRYMYESSRDDGSGVYYLNGQEWNSLTGLPLKEDPTAYFSAKAVYQASVIANAPTENESVEVAATAFRWVGLFSLAMATGGSILAAAAPAAGGWAIAGAGLSYATTAAGYGAMIGGVDTMLQGQGFQKGAAAGAQFSLAFAALQGGLPTSLATAVNWTALIGGTGYGIYDAIQNEDNPALALYRGLTGLYFGAQMLGYRINFGGGYLAEDGSYVLGSNRFLVRNGITPGEYEKLCFGGPGNKEPLDIWAVQSGFTRKPDNFDKATGTIQEASLQRWSELDLEDVHSTDFKEFNRKLGEAEADGWLLQNNPFVNQAIWYGPEPLPTSGRAAQLTRLLNQYGISYQVVKI